MPGPVCFCYMAPPGCDPPAGSALSSPGPPFMLLVRFLSRGFSLSRGLFCCQAAYLFCWGCSTYLHPSASWWVSFVSRDLSRIRLHRVTVILHRWDTTTSLSHFTIASVIGSGHVPLFKKIKLYWRNAKNSGSILDLEWSLPVATLRPSHGTVGFGKHRQAWDNRSFFSTSFKLNLNLNFWMTVLSPRQKRRLRRLVLANPC